jgi:hypothetical protein
MTAEMLAIAHAHGFDLVGTPVTTHYLDLTMATRGTSKTALGSTPSECRSANGTNRYRENISMVKGCVIRQMRPPPRWLPAAVNID